MSIEKENYFCYVVISKHGHVGVYDGNIDFLTSYHVVMTRDDIPKLDQDRRKRNRWVTDACFCKDAGTLLITNTTRSIAIYEASGIKHTLLWLILSLPNVIQVRLGRCFIYFVVDWFESVCGIMQMTVTQTAKACYCLVTIRDA